MGRPIIGITGELEAARWGNWIREAVVSPVSYTRVVERAGGAPVVLPPVPAHSIPALIAALDGLVFADGRDLDPSLYEQERHEQTDPPDHRRDRFELAMMRAVIDADLPFLAIGRGIHVLNVARGGTLTQHLPDRLGSESHKPDPVKLTPHEVQISAASRIGRALGTGSATVPAGHHQAINRIGSGLLTVAWTEDQVVEAVELQGHRFGIGVQWHPEEADDLRLFEALIAAAVESAAPGKAGEAGETAVPHPDSVPSVGGAAGPAGGAGSAAGAGGAAGPAGAGGAGAPAAGNMSQSGQGAAGQPPRSVPANIASASSAPANSAPANNVPADSGTANSRNAGKADKRHAARR